MSHRTVVAVERADGRYDVSEVPGTVLAHEHVETFRRAVVGDCPPVERRALAEAVSDAALTDHVDPGRHEALSVVARDGAVGSYLVLWFGAALGTGTDDGALVSYDPGERADEAYLRGWWHGLTDGVGALVDESIDEREAMACLRERVDALCDTREVLAL
ncbi:DUF6735 family protein [Natronorarus salvus]|uniref:DUF6735 family protein n=1 Tax=Natronorarus salvus TaxID=3117733 RepID=UPI002F26CE68